MTELTERQQVILDAILHLQEKKGYIPTRAEIGQYVGIWPTGVQSHLVLLEKKGYIDLGAGRNRAIQLLEPAP